jgi:hypothetical protein
MLLGFDEWIVEKKYAVADTDIYKVLPHTRSKSFTFNLAIKSYPYT